MLLANPTVLAFLLIVVLAAWVSASLILIDFAGKKGYDKLALLLFVGLFASPVVLGLIVLAIPDGYAEEEGDDGLPAAEGGDDAEREADYGVIGGLR